MPWRGAICQLLSLPRVAFSPLTYDDIRYGAVNERTNSAQFFVFFFFLLVLLHSATKIYFGPVEIVFFLSLGVCVCVFRVVAAACTCQTRRRASRIEVISSAGAIYQDKTCTTFLVAKFPRIYPEGAHTQHATQSRKEQLDRSNDNFMI